MTGEDDEKFQHIIHSADVEGLDSEVSPLEQKFREHQMSREEFAYSIQKFKKHPSSAPMAIGEAAQHSTITFKSYLETLLEDQEDISTCVDIATNAYVAEERWRSAFLNLLIDGASVIPSSKLEIIKGLTKFVEENDPDKESLIDVITNEYGAGIAMDLQKALPVANMHYEKKARVYRGIGKGALDVAKIAAGAAVALLIAKRFKK